MYKLNSDVPLIWRTPTSLQIGLDNPRVVLPKLYPAEERMISALRAGFADVSLTAISQECGLTSSESAALMAAVKPALEPSPIQPSWRIAIDGSGPVVDTLGLLLIASGHRVVKARASVAGRCDLAIVVGDYALDPHRPGGWLSRDVPHIPVVFSDESVRIGPLLGGTPEESSEVSEFPCEQCIELTHRDSDECWVAMISQLAGTPAPSQQPLLNAEVSAVIARLIHSPTGHQITSNTAMQISAVDGTRELVTFALHPDCACQALPRNVSVLGSSLGQCPVAPTIKIVASSLE